MLKLVMTGVCIREIRKTMPLFEKWGREEEYVIALGDTVNIYHNDDSEKPYYFRLNWQKIEMSLLEIQDHFRILYQEGNYNACIQKGVPCESLRCYQPGDTALTPRRDWTCAIRWEIGRSMCARYQPAELR